MEAAYLAGTLHLRCIRLGDLTGFWPNRAHGNTASGLRGCFPHQVILPGGNLVDLKQGRRKSMGLRREAETQAKHERNKGSKDIHNTTS